MYDEVSDVLKIGLYELSLSEEVRKFCFFPLEFGLLFAKEESSVSFDLTLYPEWDFFLSLFDNGHCLIFLFGFDVFGHFDGCFWTRFSMFSLDYDSVNSFLGGALTALFLLPLPISFLSDCFDTSSDYGICSVISTSNLLGATTSSTSIASSYALLAYSSGKMKLWLFISSFYQCLGSII